MHEDVLSLYPLNLDMEREQRLRLLKARLRDKSWKRTGPVLWSYEKTLQVKWNLIRQKISGHKPLTSKDDDWIDRIERVLDHHDKYSTNAEVQEG